MKLAGIQTPDYTCFHLILFLPLAYFDPTTTQPICSSASLSPSSALSPSTETHRRGNQGPRPRRYVCEDSALKPSGTSRRFWIGIRRWRDRCGCRMSIQRRVVLDREMGVRTMLLLRCLGLGGKSTRNLRGNIVSIGMYGESQYFQKREKYDRMDSEENDAVVYAKEEVL